MLPKLFKTSLAVYHQAEYSGKNESGWEAFGDHILVLPDHLTSKSAGGVEIPEDVVDRMTMAAEAGVIISVGEGCFIHNADGTPFVGKKPKVGDRVSMGRYSGQQVMGADSKRYRLMSSSEIAAVQGGK